VDEVHAHMQASDTGVITLPLEWLKAGRRRAREAQAHTGCNNMVAVMEYWAGEDHGARLDLVYVDPFGGAV
jgi:hypothetical protein